MQTYRKTHHVQLYGPCNSHTDTITSTRYCIHVYFPSGFFSRNFASPHKNCHVNIAYMYDYNVTGMPLGLFKKVGKYRGIGGLGLELFLNQNCPESHQLTRMVVTHTIHAQKKKGGGGGGSRNVGKSRNVNITKIMKLSHCEFPHLVQTHESICTTTRNILRKNIATFT